MIAIGARWKGDLQISCTGDIGVNTMDVEIQQRLIRRILTNPGDYIWHAAYGAGLGRFVGLPYVTDNVQSVIYQQINLESLVSKTPAPSVSFGKSGVGTTIFDFVTIQYSQNGYPDTYSTTIELVG